MSVLPAGLRPSASVEFVEPDSPAEPLGDATGGGDVPAAGARGRSKEKKPTPASTWSLAAAVAGGAAVIVGGLPAIPVGLGVAGAAGVVYATEQWKKVHATKGLDCTTLDDIPPYEVPDHQVADEIKRLRQLDAQSSLSKQEDGVTM
ncbi:hypothetical protein DIPPA_06206 [Diplonema papillatum]|nr:hypothetical protein DIPPA_06206 [Diplonema papillatum]|eukprot:gene1647-2459_t